MCVAIVTTKGTALDSTSLWNGWQSNPDGGGFAYVRDGAVVIEKGFMKYVEFRDAYLKAAERFADDSPFLVHMRIATSGGTRPINTHPFSIKGGAMIHNGIMFTPVGPRAGTTEDRKSDTRVFAESLYNILQLETVVKASRAIGKAVGSGNKLCFLYDSGDYHIVNEDMGYWAQKIWYSNGSCVSRSAR